MKKLFTTVMLFAAALFVANAQVPSQAEDVMLQAFYWNSHGETNWQALQNQADEIGSYFTLVWLPPASQAEGGGSSNMGYHPYNYGSLSSSWGNRTQLTTLINALKNKGVHVVADIVINHHAGNNACCSYPTENFGSYGSSQLDASCICRNDEVSGGTGANDAGYGEWQCGASGGYCAARDLDHSSSKVQEHIKKYLQWMKNDIGYDGWRYDLVKGYLGQYTKIYNQAAGAYMSVGEYYDANYDDLLHWVNETGNTSMVFDFAFHDAMVKWGGGSDYSKIVWKEGNTDRPAGLCHSTAGRKYAVTFIDNHDTDVSHTDGNWPYNGDWLKANAIMIAAPGIPCVFWKHWANTTCRAKIKQMIEARKAMGVHSESDVVVNHKSGYYESTATGKNGKLKCFVGSGWSDPSGYTKACYGDGWAYYTTAVVPTSPVVTMNPQGGYVGQGGKVTLTTTKGTIYYTTDGSTPSASSTRYSSPISITVNNTTVKAIAIDGSAKSDIVSGTFLTEKPAGLTVQFKAPSSWSAVALYVWDEAGAKPLGEWPGKTISKSGDYYTYTITETDARPINLIFNDNNNGHQTNNLSASADACWDGSNGGSSAKFTPTTCGGGPTPPASTIQIGVKKSGDYASKTPYIHYWDNGEESTWPGVQMKSLDANWWYYNVPTTTGTVSCLFNAGDGDASKTEDITGITSQSCYTVNSRVASVATCSGLVDVDEDVTEEFNLYPNPTTGVINIKGSTEFVSARVTNLAGQTFEYNITGNSLNVSNLAAGLYIIDLESANGTVEKSKFIKK